MVLAVENVIGSPAASIVVWVAMKEEGGYAAYYGQWDGDNQSNTQTLGEGEIVYALFADVRYADSDPLHRLPPVGVRLFISGGRSNDWDMSPGESFLFEFQVLASDAGTLYSGDYRLNLTEDATLYLDWIAPEPEKLSQEAQVEGTS